LVTGSYTLSYREAVQAPESTGAKAALLGRLASAGFRVPGGFVLSAAAYHDFRRAAGIERAIRRFGERHGDPFRESALFELDRIRLACLRTSLPESVRSSIMSALAQCGILGLPVVVRPSVACEDETDAEFERVHPAALNLLGLDAVDKAVRACWASLWLPRAVAYRRRAGIREDALSMAVIIQRFVPADAGGVAFTRDPATGDERVEIRSAWGLGEAVSAGKAEPDRFLFRPEGDLLALAGSEVGSKLQIARPRAVGGITWQSTTRDQRRRSSLTLEQAAAIAETCRRIEQALGAPQAIEWARVGDDVSLLQTRPLRESGAPEAAAAEPLAAAPNPPPWGTRVWSPAALVAALPVSSTPLTWSLTCLLSEQALQRVLGARPAEAWGNGPFLSRQEGRPHLEVSALQWFAWEQWGLAPEATARLVGSREAGLPAEALPACSGWQLMRRRWRRLGFSIACRQAASRGKPRLLLAARRLADLERRLLQSLSDLDLLDASVANAETALGYLPEVIRAMCRSASALFRLEETLARRMGADYSPALLGEVLAREGSALGMRAAELLRRLARQAAEETQAREALEQTVSPGSGDSDTGASEAWLARFAGTRAEPLLRRFLHRFGHHSLVDMELSEPRWSEDCRYPLRVAASYLATDLPAMQGARPRSRVAWAQAKRHLNLWEQYRCRRLIGSLLHSVHLQEAAHALLARQAALERRFCLEAGARLASRQALEAAEDVFFLNASELRAFLMGEDPKGDTRAAVARRRRELSSEEGADARFGDRMEDQAGSATAALAGLGVSGGRATGRARILRGPAEGWNLQPGEIVVAPRIGMAWAPILLRAGGVILEGGGLLSQGALLARECGVPAVSEISDATTRIAEGARVVVDGTRGKVEILGGSGA
jgi:phosphohistidine swiveling domain-containing protein